MSLLTGAIALSSAAHAAVTISAGATSNMSCTGGVCSPTAANAVLNVGDLTTMLASGNVDVTTGSGSLAQQVQDIVVAAGFNWAGANALTLDAYRSVTVNQPVADNGSGAVVLTTNDGGSGGVLYFGTKGSLSFLGTANSLTINSTVFTLENSVKALATAMAANPSGSFALSASYDAAQDGTYSQAPITVALTGTMEGLGNTISNLSIDTLHRGGIVGLFSGFNHDQGTVEGVVLKGLSIRCTGYRGCIVGGIAGNTGKLLFNDSVAGKLEGQNAEMGGLAALNDGSIVSSEADVTIHESGAAHGRTYSGFVGGLVATNAGTIEMSRSAGSVSGAKYVGGMVGFNTGGTIDQSFSTATVTGSDQALVGGFIGASNNDVLQVSNSYATGAVSGGSGADVGGFVGNNFYMIVPIESSYSTGAPTGGGALGGFSGTAGYFTDAYWDTTTSGTDQGTGSGNHSGLTGLTTAQLRSGLPAGFDPTIWAESKKINNGLPYLINNPPPK